MSTLTLTPQPVSSPEFPLLTPGSAVLAGVGVLASSAFQLAAMDCQVQIPWPDGYKQLADSIQAVSMKPSNGCTPAVICWPILLSIIYHAFLLQVVLNVVAASVWLGGTLVAYLHHRFGLRGFRFGANWDQKIQLIMFRMILMKVFYNMQWAYMLFVFGAILQHSIVMAAGSCIDTTAPRMTLAVAFVLLSGAGLGFFIYCLHRSWVVRQVARFVCIMNTQPCILVPIMGTSAATQEETDVLDLSYRELQWSDIPGRMNDSYYAFTIGRLRPDYAVWALMFLFLRQFLGALTFLVVRIPVFYCIVSILLNMAMLAALVRFRFFQPRLDFTVHLLVSIGLIFKFSVALVLLTVGPCRCTAATVILNGLLLVMLLPALRVAYTLVQNIGTFFRERCLSGVHGKIHVVENNQCTTGLRKSPCEMWIIPKMEIGNAEQNSNA